VTEEKQIKLWIRTDMGFTENERANTLAMMAISDSLAWLKLQSKIKN